MDVNSSHSRSHRFRRGCPTEGGEPHGHLGALPGTADTHELMPDIPHQPQTMTIAVASVEMGKILQLHGPSFHLESETKKKTNTIQPDVA